MNKRTLYTILFIDLLVMAGALYVIFNQISAKKSVQFLSSSRIKEISSQRHEPPVQQEAVSPASQPAVGVARAEPLPAQGSDNAMRRILFTYRNSKPARVSIVGEFNDWKPQPMTKGLNHIWSVSVELIPGDYLYGYLADDRFVPDPNNPRTRTASDGRKCSFITIKPLLKGNAP